MKFLIILLIVNCCGSSVYGANIANVPQDELIAATLILEAGGEQDPRAMQAVFEVINNRVKLRLTSYRAEILRNKQFSCWNNLSAEELINKINKAKNHKNWSRAFQIANNKQNKEITNGATHYHTTKIMPYWSKYLRSTITIGNHIFYK